VRAICATSSVCVIRVREEHLRLAREPPECLRVDDAIAIVLEDGPHRIGRLWTVAALALPALLSEPGKHPFFVLFQLLPDRHRCGYLRFFFGRPP
jgi:hypothetical protein